MVQASAHTIITALKSYASTKKSKDLSRFFKTGKGQYGEGDKFIGIVVPSLRKVAKKYASSTSLETVDDLLKSPIHEVRLCALLILVSMYKKADTKGKKKIFAFYIAHTKMINNWDLVDLTAPNIVGDYLLNLQTSSSGLTRGSMTSILPRHHVLLAPYPTGEPRRLRKPGVLGHSHPELVEGSLSPVLFNFAQSTSLWERRIAIVSTFAFIRSGRHQETFAAANMLLYDKHDLIHKAVGWMLREVGKRIGKDTLREFLDKHASTMPRTALRYAIEHMDKDEREKYM
ncbi:DNA alkylation repair protein, partial [Candidatus Woesebacteria bacterium]|nr:DNA alkylation repair protein [Candidatus Woesebacteria bacterium]